MDYITKRENVRYQEFLRKLEERMPAIKEHLHSSEEHRECFFRIMSMSERLLDQLRDPSHLEDRIGFLERLLQEVEEISSYATRTLETLREMRTGQGLSLASDSEEDITLFNNTEDEGQTDAGKLQHEDEKRHEKIFEILLGEIKEAVQKEEIPQNVLNEIPEKLLEHQSEDFSLRMVLGEKVEESKKNVGNVLALIMKPGEKFKNFLAIKVAHEVLGLLKSGEARMQEIFKHVFEEAVKKDHDEEPPEEVLGEEAAGDEENKKILKTLSAKVIAKTILQEVATNKALMQEIVKNALQGANKDLQRKSVTLAVALGKSIRKAPMEEVAEVFLEDGYLIEDVLEQLFVNLLQGKNASNILFMQENVKYQEFLRKLEERKAVQKEEIPQNVLNEIPEKLLEHQSEDLSLRMVLGEKMEESKKKVGNVLALIMKPGEKFKNFLAIKVAHEVLGLLKSGDARMQEIFKHVFEEAVKKGHDEEPPEEVLGEEAAGEEENKKILKTLSAKVIAKAIVKEVATNKALMQEIVENALQEAAKDMQRKSVTIAVKQDPRNTRMEKVAEVVLEDRYLMEDVLEKFFVNVLLRKTEQKEEVKQKLRVKMQEKLEIEDGKIQKQQQENPEIIQRRIFINIRRKK